MKASKSPIIFGRINKRLLLPVLLSITQIILLIVNNCFEPDKIDLVSSLYSLSLGQIIIKFLPCILKISNHDEKKEKVVKQRKCLHYFFLCGLFFLDQIIHTGYNLCGKFLLGWKMKISFNESNLFMVQDFLILSLELVFMAIFSRFLLKDKYFKHHIISIILFILLGITCDIIIITTNKTKMDEITPKLKYYFIVKSILIINALVDALYFSYQKYLMEVLYYPYWNIAFIPGVFIFVAAAIILIITLAIPEEKRESIEFVKNFYYYYKETNGWVIFGKIILLLVIHIILCPLTILVIFYYSPNFLLIIFQISTIVYNLIKNTKESLYCIPLFVVQFLALMIHLEILELNFCGLNKYTKRYIELRGLLESLSQNEERDSTAGREKIDINNDYFVEGNIKNERATEMEEKLESIAKSPANYDNYIIN